MRTDDRHVDTTKPTVAFRNSANAPKSTAVAVFAFATILHLLIPPDYE